MTIEEMKKRKIELGYSYERISKLSGVPLGTVQKIFCGVTKAPRYDTLRALEGVFVELSAMGGAIRESAAPYGGRGGEAASDNVIGDASVGYAYALPTKPALKRKKQGQYTIDDYFALPDERRVELINGVFYDMASPTSGHQAISMYISSIFFNFIQANNGKCRVYTAPLDVQLNRDDKTMVQPDILVVCDREKYREGIIYGAPELTVEVLSDSTRGKDLVLKLNKYCEAGVAEYWTVDPKKKEITVYKFETDIKSSVYDSESEVPVGIWDDKCKVSVVKLFEYAGYEGL